MKPLTIDQLTELNSIYCVVLLKSFKEMTFKKLVLANFIIKYPFKLDRLGFKLPIEENEKKSIFSKKEIKFNESWDKITLDSLKILIAKELAIFDDKIKDLVKKTDLTNKFINSLKKFEEFDNILLRAELIKNILNKTDEKEVVKILNG